MLDIVSPDRPSQIVRPLGPIFRISRMAEAGAERDCGSQGSAMSHTKWLTQGTTAIAAVFLFIAGMAGHWQAGSSELPAGPQRQCRRIVSLAPSTTETLFAVGLGDRVVGVSRFCDYPPEASSRSVVGGYVDLNYEAVLAVRPDLVVGLKEHRIHRRNLQKLGIPALLVDHQSLDGVWESLEIIDAACGADGRGRLLAAHIRRRLDQVQQRFAGRRPPRVLLVLEREGSAHRVASCRVVGIEGYFDRMIELAGGINACRDTWVRYPMVSVEGLLSLAPEVIIDMSPAAKAVAEAQNTFNEAVTANGAFPADQRLAAWKSLPLLPAVRTGRVFALHADYAFRPGPRVIETIEAIASLLHAETDALRPAPGANGD